MRWRPVRFLIFGVGLAPVLLSACLAHPDNVQDPAAAFQTATKALGVPTKLDGALDTGWEYYHFLSTTCDPAEPYLCELFSRAKTDTYLSEVLAQNVGKQRDALVINGNSSAKLEALMNTIGDGNDAWLEDVMSNITWFTLGEFGKDADKAAFFLLQHSSNLDLQKKGAVVLEALAKEGRTDPKNAGFLRDRISLKMSEPQLYGTQGHCVGKGVWQPFELVDPENVEARRSEIGLPALGDYVHQMSRKYCQ